MIIIEQYLQVTKPKMAISQLIEPDTVLVTCLGNLLQAIEIFNHVVLSSNNM